MTSHSAQCVGYQIAISSGYHYKKYAQSTQNYIKNILNFFIILENKMTSMHLQRTCNILQQISIRKIKNQLKKNDNRGMSQCQTYKHLSFHKTINMHSHKKLYKTKKHSES